MAQSNLFKELHTAQSGVSTEIALFKVTFVHSEIMQEGRWDYLSIMSSDSERHDRFLVDTPKVELHTHIEELQ